MLPNFRITGCLRCINLVFQHPVRILFDIVVAGERLGDGDDSFDSAYFQIILKNPKRVLNSLKDVDNELFKKSLEFDDRDYCSENNIVDDKPLLKSILEKTKKIDDETLESKVKIMIERIKEIISMK